MDKITLYQKAKTGKTKVWSGWIVLKGDSGSPEINYEWGLTDGKKQLTTDIISTGVNEGKANETTPLEQAILTLERKIRKKKEEGYSENISNIEIEDVIDFTKPLSKSLCFYKPKNSIDDKKLAQLYDTGRLMLSVKYDGMCYEIRKSKSFGVEIYSRRMELETDKFPHIVTACENLPDGIILRGEMTYPGYKNHMKAFKAVTRVCRSDVSESIAKQKELGKISYRIFDVAFVNHECWLTSRKYIDRYNKALSFAIICDSEYIKCIDLLNMSHANAIQYVIDNNLEGLVIWDAHGIMKSNAAYTFNGKSSRPAVVFKSKPKFNDDFIVRFDPKNEIGEYGKGKNNGKIKSAFVYQLDDNGNEVFLGKCGGGLSDAQRDFYTIAEYPRCWEIEYDAIQPETGSLRYPVFKADRTIIGDKLIGECLLSEDIKEAMNSI